MYKCTKGHQSQKATVLFPRVEPGPVFGFLRAGELEYNEGLVSEHLLPPSMLLVNGLE